MKSGSLILPAPSFFLKIALGIWGLLCFHTNCDIFCCSSVKNGIDSMIRIALIRVKEVRRLFQVFSQLIRQCLCWLIPYTETLLKLVVSTIELLIRKLYCTGEAYADVEGRGNASM